ncbi:MAG: amidohydrolase family protein, partial [Bacteroidota bacterium]|nr:amidohydrolase family protein [Bacteroidota bacterium]
MGAKKMVLSGLVLLVVFSGVAEDKNTNTIDALLYSNGKPVSVKISGDKISKVTALKSSAKAPQMYVAPGLIDIQINGYMGVDFADQDLTLEGIRKATRALWKEGVTTYLPTLITADRKSLKNSFSILSQALADEEIGPSIPGFHLEGPFISPEKGFRGAHLEKYIRKPDWNEFAELQQAAKHKIKLITVAPEIDGAVPFIQNCSRGGVIVSLGHH